MTVKLADYKNGAITVKVPKMDVSEAQVRTWQRRRSFRVTLCCLVVCSEEKEDEVK